MDQCTNCTMKGNLPGCQATPCSQHESWMVLELLKLLKEAPNYFAVCDFEDRKLQWLKKAGFVEESYERPEPL